jgi:predicted anti-sigma-YlaC factor YlaD
MTVADEMDCRDLAELVTEFLEGVLAPRARATVEAHLAGCDGCTEYLEQMRTTIRLTGRLTEAQIPEEAREPLRSAFLAWRSAG